MTACSHTEPVVLGDPPSEGPYSEISPVRLTFNPGQDLEPGYAADGNSIVYTYEMPGRVDHDRCVGVLPAAGGTRLAEVCERRPGTSDSTNALATGALSESGRLLVLHATSRINASLPHSVRLQLSDTVFGSVPRTLLTFPINLDGEGIDWLSNIRWTGDNTFLALAQLQTLVPLGGAARDTLFIPKGVVRGTISGNVATLARIPGAGNAASYGISADGTAVIVAGGQPLSRVPLDGSAPTPILLAGPGTVSVVDCRAGRCVGIAGNSVYAFAETGGTATAIADATTARPATLRISPTRNDFVLVRGLGGRDLYLFRGSF